MPRQNFTCPRCRTEHSVVYAMPRYDADHNRIDPWPSCDVCWAEMEPFPRQMNHDLLTGGTGLEVTTEDGSTTVVSSLQEIRAIEDRSLRRHRNGEGEPIVFRGFSQNHSNRDVNTLDGTSYQRNKQIPFERATHAGAIRVKVTEEPEGK